MCNNGKRKSCSNNGTKLVAWWYVSDFSKLPCFLIAWTKISNILSNGSWIMLFIPWDISRSKIIPTNTSSNRKRIFQLLDHPRFWGVGNYVSRRFFPRYSTKNLGCKLLHSNKSLQDLFTKPGSYKSMLKAKHPNKATKHHYTHNPQHKKSPTRNNMGYHVIARKNPLPSLLSSIAAIPKLHPRNPALRKAQQPFGWSHSKPSKIWGL